MASTADFKFLLLRAIQSQFGIVVEVSDLVKARQKLYSIRREMNDPSLTCLELRPAPGNPNQLWIVKKGASLAEAPE